MPALAEDLELDIWLQPKQLELGDLIENSFASWIGYGGSRGGGKSGSSRRLMLDRRMRYPGTWGAIIRRTYDEVKRNHIDEFFREYPQLQQYYRISDHELVLPNGSKIVFLYAQTLEEVQRKFMGGQYMDLMCDQAEQFSEQEHREMKQACRWPGMPVGSCKYIMFFNMGGVGIQYLKRIFHLKEYRQNERPDDYAFVHAYAWDNISWVEPALANEGISIADYYSWSDADRMVYCLNKSDYGINLNSQDEALRKRDLFGSWDSLEGAYFGAVFDRDKTVVSQEQLAVLVKPWWNRWLSLDWGRAHHSAIHWHARGSVSPEEALRILGWAVDKPLKLAVTYREYVVNETSERDIAEQIVERTPASEKATLLRFFASPDIFGKRSSANTIAEEIDDVLRAAGFPALESADNDRIGGWALMYNLLLETKRMAATGDECWLISANCPEAINAIPLLMRDPKHMEDVQKTTHISDDVGDGLRYGLKSMLDPRTLAPKDVRAQEIFDSYFDMTSKAMAMRVFEAKESERTHFARRRR